MDVDRVIDEIGQLQEMFEAPDIRPLSAATSLLPIEGTTKTSRIALVSSLVRLWQRNGPLLSSRRWRLLRGWNSD
jgi:hypothetical protein